MNTATKPVPLQPGNVDVEGLKAYLGERAVDRLRENGGRVLIFDWQSHRRMNRVTQTKCGC